MPAVEAQRRIARNRPEWLALLLVLWSGSSRAADAFQPRLFRLTPGTNPGPRPPPGWSHLVIKSAPRLASGDLASLPASAAGTATLFHTVIAADVRRSDDDRFVLARIGVGLAVPGRDGRDVVITSERLDQLPVTLSTVDRL